MDLATRIAKTPDAYLSRFNRIDTARSAAELAKASATRSLMFRIFMGPVGEFWMTSSITVAKALKDAGYEMAEFC